MGSHRNKQFIKIKYLIIILHVMFSVPFIYAEEVEDVIWVKEGLYLGGYSVQSSIEGEFDDYIYSDVDDGSGTAFVIGGRAKKYAFELSYFRTDHTSTSPFPSLGEQDTSLSLINIDFKFDVFAMRQARPYGLIGIGFPRLTIENGMYEAGSYTDETFRGLCLNLGGGLAYYITPQWSINTGVAYHWITFYSVNGENLYDNVSGNNTNLFLGLTYTF